MAYDQLQDTSSEPLTDPNDSPRPSVDVSDHDTPMIRDPYPLPEFVPSPDPDFVWGALDGRSFAASIKTCYNELVHLKRNLFKVPVGTCCLLL